jgi:DNA-binding MarR family transcriptional regulator
VTFDREALVAEVERVFQEMTWRGRRHFARIVETFGLTVPQYLALHTIGKLGPDVTMGEVSDALFLPASTMTSVVDRLVKDGLVERGTRPGDRRSVVARLTPAGENLVANVEEVRHTELVTMLEDMSGDDLADFARHLARLVEGIDRAIVASDRPRP